MARIARVVAVGMAHHVTQRGINREAVFPSDAARVVYLSLLREHAERQRLRILGYCLMTNHVHLFVVPDREDALARTFRYTSGTVRAIRKYGAQQIRAFLAKSLFLVPGRGPCRGNSALVH